MSTDISGFARPGFEAVRDAFVGNFERGKELGAACCVYHRGEKVVDLWGGIRDAATGEPWKEDTMALVFSSTKGMAGLAMALAHSRGLFGYDERVSTYWPEFAQQGQGSDHGPAAVVASGRSVRAWMRDSTGASWRTRSIGGRARATEAGLAAGSASGLPRHHTRLL